MALTNHDRVDGHSANSMINSLLVIKGDIMNRATFLLKSENDFDDLHIGNLFKY